MRSSFSAGDLCIRIGLHSGPVTVGVLRGEKSRFQLFGDTVNTGEGGHANDLQLRFSFERATLTTLKFSLSTTAARIESTEKRNHRIHISQETADLVTICFAFDEWIWTSICLFFGMTVFDEAIGR
jgi:hypothetical protein